jgi:predicted transcriptional regulator
MDTTLDSVQSFEQFVLLSIVELSTAGETPAHSYEVTETAKARTEDIDRDPFGGIERQEVITALGSLADAGLLAKSETKDAVGKGRPAYELAVGADEVLDPLSGDDNVGSYAQSLRA